MNTTKLKVNPRYFWTMLTALVIGLTAHVFFVQGSIYYSLSANALSSLLQTKEGELAALEGDFYIVSRDADIDKARELGFVDLEQVTFASLETPGDLVGYAVSSH